MIWRLLTLGLLGIFSGCSDPELITNNVDNPNNVSTNNQTTPPQNNTIIGIECDDSSQCTPPAAMCQGTVAISYTGNGLCSSETGICNFFFVTERVDCTVTTQTCENGACVDNACTGVVCDTPRSRCDGNVEVFYATPSRCVLPAGTCQDMETRFDCSSIGAECLIDGCYGNCVGIACNTPPAPACEGDVAVTHGGGTCNPDDGSCSYTETRTDCTEMDRVCRGGACVSDLCAGVNCPQPAPACEGTNAKTYSGAGMCVPATGMCDFSAVEVVTDCAASGQLCGQGACVANLCAGVNCPQPANVCENNMAKTYSGAGMCMPTNGMCNYSAVETIVDCMAMTCINAQCVNVTPAAGELIITEIMHSPMAVAGEFGEWFEIKNVSTRALNLNGLILASGGDLPYTVMLGGLTLLDPGEHFVFGINSDMGTNNNVPVDAAYDGLVLDAVDMLEIRVGATVIDSVSWDSTGAWPAGLGASMNFGAQHAPANNNLPANWCDSTTALGTDFGTPGQTNINCP